MTVVEPNKRTIRLNNGQQSIYLDIIKHKHSFKLRTEDGEVFKFGSAAELILGAIYCLDRESEG
jgi:RNase P/RNase MRP subunit p29